MNRGIITRTVSRHVLWTTCLAAVIAHSATPIEHSGSPDGDVAEFREEAGEHLLPDWTGSRRELQQRGVEFSLAYVGEVLANTLGGLEPGAIYEDLVKLGVDLDTEKSGLCRSGAWHICLLYPHGASLSEKYLGDLFTFSNIDAADSVRLFELWYEQALVDDRLTVRVGQLAADEEFVGTDYGGAFVNGTCGWPAMIAANAPTPAYPVATPGIRAAVSIGGSWLAQVGAYNCDPYPVDDEGHPMNEHGLDFSIQDAFVIAELRREWNPVDGARGLTGRAKLGGWYHTAEFDHLRWDEAGLSLADPASTGQPLTLDGNWGVYFVAEQQLWRENPEADPDQGVGMFVRLGGSPDGRSLVESYAESGLICTGLIPGRDADTCGVAVVYGQISRELRDLGRDANRFSSGSAPLPDFEMVVEWSYLAELSPGIMAQPVLAGVIHPGGSSALDDALVVGLRLTLDL